MGFAYPPPSHYLLSGERRVLRTRQHRIKLVPKILLTVVFVLTLMMLAHLVAGHGLAFITSVLWYGALAAIGWLALLIADWWDNLIMLTDARIINVTGLIVSRARDTPIKKITDRDVQASLVGRLLGLDYGTIKIESAGIDSLQKLEYVPDLMTVYKAIVMLASDEGLPPPADGKEESGDHPSIEDETSEWPKKDRR